MFEYVIKYFISKYLGVWIIYYINLEVLHIIYHWLVLERYESCLPYDM